MLQPSPLEDLWDTREKVQCSHLMILTFFLLILAKTVHLGDLCFTAGSVMSLMAGLVFGGLSAYGAFNISNDTKDIKISLREYFISS